MCGALSTGPHVTHCEVGIISHRLFGEEKGGVTVRSVCPQDDEVVLQCNATVLKEQLKLCLAAEGFGNRLCFLEPTSNAQVCVGVCGGRL